MGKRDSLYQLDQIIELDEEFFRATADEKQTDESKKRGRESQTQAKVLVMVSSRISMDKDKDLTKYAKPTQLKYIEMHVIDNLKDETMTDKIKQETKPDSVVKTDDFRSYSKLSENVCRHSQNSHDLVNTPIQIQLFGKNCSSTICDDCDIILYSNSIFRIPPKRLNTQLSLHPLEEGFHSPSFFIQKINVLSLKKEIIGIVSESSLQFWFVIHNSSDNCRIISPVSIRCESHGLVSKDIISAFQKIFSVNHLKFRSAFFSYDEKRIKQFNAVKTLQIPVTTVKNVTSKRFVINPVHALYIMHRCFCNIKRDWYLGHNIKLGMNLINTVYWILAKSKMERLFRMSGSNIRQFTKAIASIQLSEHEHEHLIPMSQIPALGSIIADHHDESLKVSFGKKIGNLTENILAAVHCALLFGLSPKVVCSKVRQGFYYKTY